MTGSGERFTDVELENKRLPACHGYITHAALPLEEAMGDLHVLLPEIVRFVKYAKRYCTYPNEHNLTKDEAATVYLYTMEMSKDASIYRILNQALRAENRAEVHPWFAYLKLLDSAASKLPDFKGIVWRGVNKDVSQTFRKGQRITWWSVSSCSTSVDVISSFLNKAQSTLFSIECSTGKSITAYTCFPNENEVILMPGTMFKVVSNPLHHHGGLHMIHLKEITDDDNDSKEEGAIGSVTSHAATATSVAQKPNNMSLDFIPNILQTARWAQNGVTVAAGNGEGLEVNQLYSPMGIYVDDDQTIYIAEANNHRIVKWKCDATSVQIVAGGNGQGNRADQLNHPRDVIVDKETDSLIICDQDNRRVMRWSRQNRTSGEIMIENIDCFGLMMDDQRFLYVSDQKKHEVRRYRMGETNGIVVAGGNKKGDRLDQLYSPTFIFVDRDYSVYVSDWNNNRVMKWKKDATQGIIVAGDKSEGNALHQLSSPRGVFVDTLGTVYVADWGNDRVMRWCKEAVQGDVIVGGNGSGKEANQLNCPIDLSFDRHGNLYVVDYYNQRVQRFSIEQ